MLHGYMSTKVTSACSILRVQVLRHALNHPQALRSVMDDTITTCNNRQDPGYAAALKSMGFGWSKVRQLCETPYVCLMS